jgi:SAM-dependent methyltransferase
VSKFDQGQYEAYWQRVHAQTDDDLLAVCHPDKPRYYNLYANRVQTFAISTYLKREQIDLRGKRLLDVGCGRGRWLHFYRSRFNAASVGIDLARDAVESCRRKGFDAYQASATALPFASASFDALNCVTVLLHIPYEAKADAVNEIARVLKPGGRAILLESTYKADPSPHVYGLGLDDWREMFGRTGLRLVHQSGHYFNLFRLRWLPRRLPKRDLFAIYLDYPLEYLLMRRCYGRATDLGLQHVMIFEKPAQHDFA